MAAFVTCAHAAAAGCSILVLPALPGSALAAAILALGWTALERTALLRSASSVRAIELDHERVLVELADGRKFPAEFAARRHVTRHTVALPLVRPVRRTILIASDMLSADSFRLLRIWALWGRTPGVAAKQLAA